MTTDRDEIVSARLANGTRSLRKKGWCWDHGVPYRHLNEQPLTPKERRALERENAELADVSAVVAKLGKRGDSEQRGIGGCKVVLTEKEKRSIHTTTGVWPDDAQHARRILKQKGMRFLEKGERTESMLQAHIDHADSKADERGEKIAPEHDFGGWDDYGAMPRKPGPSFEECLAEAQREHG